MKRALITLIIIIVFVLFLIGILFLIKVFIIDGVNDAEETIERCKSEGWDGAKFQSPFTTKMICSNFSQAEKDARSSQ